MNANVTRPWTVAAACAVSLGITVWDIVSTVSDEELLTMKGFAALIVALSLIPIIFTLAAYFRRNWGRIVLTIITALALLVVPALLLIEMGVPALLQLEPGEQIIDIEIVLYAIAEAIVIVLLFMPASNAWYREAGAEPK
jgi:hypothetical protein